MIESVGCVFLVKGLLNGKKFTKKVWALDECDAVEHVAFFTLGAFVFESVEKFMGVSNEQLSAN